MTTNAIPSPLMEVMDQALTRADVWRRETVRDGLSVGSLAFAADVVDRLNAEGYVIVRADGIQALWHENEHLKQRLTEHTTRIERACGCGRLHVGIQSVRDDAHDQVHRWDGPCHSL